MGYRFAVLCLVALTQLACTSDATSVDVEDSVAEADGVLECPESERLFQTAEFLEGTSGSESPVQELRSFLGQWTDRFASAEVSIIDDRRGSLVIDDQEKVTAVVRRAPAGGWIVQNSSFCRGFELR